MDLGSDPAVEGSKNFGGLSTVCSWPVHYSCKDVMDI